MGQAKLRGTFLERKVESLNKKQYQKETIKRLKEKEVIPPPFVVFEIAVSPDKTQTAVCLSDQKNRCLLDQMLFPTEMFNADKGKRCISLFRTMLKINYVI